MLLGSPSSLETENTMNSGIPILMISMQIPILPDTDAEQVLEAIGFQISQALDSIRDQQGDLVDGDSDAEESLETGTAETLEPFTDGTKDDLLTALGYMPSAES